MKKLLTKLYGYLGYHFKNKDFLKLSLSHRSSTGKESNERLEFLGDSLLDFFIADALYHRYPEITEGKLSRLRANLVNGVVLAELARKLHIGEFLHLGPGELKSGGAERDSILADAFEAVIGAIYLDSDINVCRNKVLGWYAKRLDKIHEVSGKDAKTELQELLQSMKLPLPVYHIDKISGDPHAQVFHIECKVQGLKYITRGVGNTKRKAEQQAAELFLEKLRAHT